MKKKLKTIFQLKSEVWVLFSRWIRQRDADENGMVKCCTCLVVKHWKQMQAGHFIPGRRNANLFDERGCHAQCYSCNCGWLKGNPREYDAFMRRVYGEEVIKELEKQNRVIKSFQPSELEKLKIKYQQS